MNVSRTHKINWSTVSLVKTYKMNEVYVCDYVCLVFVFSSKLEHSLKLVGESQKAVSFYLFVFIFQCISCIKNEVQFIFDRSAAQQHVFWCDLPHIHTRKKRVSHVVIKHLAPKSVWQTFTNIHLKSFGRNALFSFHRETPSTPLSLTYLDPIPTWKWSLKSFQFQIHSWQMHHNKCNSKC